MTKIGSTAYNYGEASQVANQTDSLPFQSKEVPFYCQCLQCYDLCWSRLKHSTVCETSDSLDVQILYGEPLLSSKH